MFEVPFVYAQKSRNIGVTDCVTVYIHELFQNNLLTDPPT